MTGVAVQADLFEAADLADAINAFLMKVLREGRRPSALEFVLEVQSAIGPKSRWDLHRVVCDRAADMDLPRYEREYLRSLLESGDLDRALGGQEAPNADVMSTIDALIHSSAKYRNTAAFQEMIDFIGRFRDYAPFNVLLVRIQNPSCSFFATASHWRKKFGRTLKEDARPMVLLAPMRPVFLVYDVDQTEGRELPKELNNFARFTGSWNPSWLENAIRSATSHRIRVNIKNLSSTQAGFATIDGAANKWKMRIAIHDGLDGPSQFGVLCHELAHVLLGHLGTDQDRWWPGRLVDRHTAEIEAEAVAHIVAARFGLAGNSATYICRHLKSGELPKTVSLDYIAKTAGHIEQMARRPMPARRPRPRPDSKRAARRNSTRSGQ